MKYKIICKQNNNSIASYSSESIPNIGDYLFFPHKGSYKVHGIIRYISDDCEDFDNTMMYIYVDVQSR